MHAHWAASGIASRMQGEPSSTPRPEPLLLSVLMRMHAIAQIAGEGMGPRTIRSNELITATGASQQQAYHTPHDAHATWYNTSTRPPSSSASSFQWPGFSVLAYLISWCSTMVTVIGSPLLSHCVCSLTLAYRGLLGLQRPLSLKTAQKPVGEMEVGTYQLIKDAEEGQYRDSIEKAEEGQKEARTRL